MDKTINETQIIEALASVTESAAKMTETLRLSNKSISLLIEDRERLQSELDSEKATTAHLRKMYLALTGQGEKGEANDQNLLVSDNLGNAWEKCERSDCELQVVGPGDARCYKCEEEEEEKEKEKEEQEQVSKDLREELQSVLDNWNDMVSAIGAPTHGTAVAHARRLKEEVKELRRRKNELEQALSAIARSNPATHFPTPPDLPHPCSRCQVLIATAVQCFPSDQEL